MKAGGKMHLSLKRSMQYCLTIIFLVMVSVGYAQDKTAYRIKVKTEKYNAKKESRLIPESDSLSITFMYSFKNDIMSFKSGGKEYKSDTLDADNLYGTGGDIRIAKADIRKPVRIYFNGTYIGTLKVKRRFSYVHLEYPDEKGVFTWIYRRYKFVFL